MHASSGNHIHARHLKLEFEMTTIDILFLHIYPLNCKTKWDSNSLYTKYIIKQQNATCLGVFGLQDCIRDKIYSVFSSLDSTSQFNPRWIIMK